MNSTALEFVIALLQEAITPRAKGGSYAGEFRILWGRSALLVNCEALVQLGWTATWLTGRQGVTPLTPG